MGKKILIIGLSMIFLGLIGLILNANAIGYAISSFSVSDENTTSLEFSEIEDISIREGGKRTINLNVKNTGNNLLTNCKLLAKDQIENWIHSTQIKEINPNEQVDFTFDINAPEETESTIFQGKLELNCEQITNSQDLTITILKGNLKSISIKSINRKNKILNINYTFNNSDFIGDSISIEIRIENSDEIEVKKIIDIFSINKDYLIERNILVNLNNQPTGIYNIYFALSSDPTNHLKKTIVIGKNPTTGRVIFKISKGKGFPYLIFLIIIGIGVYFIFRRHRKSIQQNIKDTKPIV